MLLNEYSSQRGQIVVQGDAIAQSNASNDELKYLRSYANGPVYAPVTGYYSFTYGTTGIEDAENDILSGDAADLFTTKLGNILTGRNPRGGSVELTLNKAAQTRRLQRDDPATARSSAARSWRWTRRPARSWPWCRRRPSTRTSWPATTPTRSRRPTRPTSTTRASRCSTGRCTRPTRPARSSRSSTRRRRLKKGVKPDDKIPAPNSYWPLEPKRTSSCPGNLSAPCVQNFEGEKCQNGKTATLAFALAKSCNTAFAALAVEKLGAAGAAGPGPAVRLRRPRPQRARCRSPVRRSAARAC